jgi:hypothetical protein
MLPKESKYQRLRQISTGGGIGTHITSSSLFKNSKFSNILSPFVSIYTVFRLSASVNISSRDVSIIRFINHVRS